MDEATRQVGAASIVGHSSYDEAAELDELGGGPCTRRVGWRRRRCGHVQDGHLHFRAGTDCPFCGCRAYRAPARPPHLGRTVAGRLTGALAAVVGAR